MTGLRLDGWVELGKVNGGSSEWTFGCLLVALLAKIPFTKNELNEPPGIYLINTVEHIQYTQQVDSASSCTTVYPSDDLSLQAQPDIAPRCYMVVRRFGHDISNDVAADIGHTEGGVTIIVEVQVE